MKTAFSDRVLDVAFKAAKIVSVFLALALVLAFLGGIGWSAMQIVGGDEYGTEEISFDNEFNQSQSSMSGAVAARGQEASGRQIALSNKLRSKYGDALGRAMTDAKCSSDQYEATMLMLTGYAGNSETESFVDDLVSGAIKWFNGAAAYQNSVGKANPDWYCGSRYWQLRFAQLQAEAAQREQRMAEVLKGFEFSILALLAAFYLMVVPAIYRIEESVRNRPRDEA